MSHPPEDLKKNKKKKVDGGQHVFFSSYEYWMVIPFFPAVDRFAAISRLSKFETRLHSVVIDRRYREYRVQYRPTNKK